MKIIAILLVILTFSFYSCESDEKDTEKPEIEILSPNEDDIVSGEIEIKISADDNEKIDRVELFIDFDLYETITGYEDYYRFNWDTDLGGNGDYVITAKAYDDSENSSESEPITVTVVNYRNLLLTNKTMQSVDFDIDHDYGYISGVIEYLDTLTVRVPKQTVISFEAWHQMINAYSVDMVWDDDIHMNESDESFTLYVDGDYFYLFLATEWRVGFDWVIVNQDLVPEITYYTNILNDGVFDDLGYYDAGTNSNIYCYFDNDPDYEYFALDPLYLPMVDHQYTMIGLYSDGTYLEYYNTISDDDIGGGTARVNTAKFGTEKYSPQPNTQREVGTGLILNEPSPNLDHFKSSISKNLKEFSTK